MGSGTSPLSSPLVAEWQTRSPQKGVLRYCEFDSHLGDMEDLELTNPNISINRHSMIVDEIPSYFKWESGGVPRRFFDILPLPKGKKWVWRANVGLCEDCWIGRGMIIYVCSFRSHRPLPFLNL